MQVAGRGGSVGRVDSKWALPGSAVGRPCRHMCMRAPKFQVPSSNLHPPQAWHQRSYGCTLRCISGRAVTSPIPHPPTAQLQRHQRHARRGPIAWPSRVRRPVPFTAFCRLLTQAAGTPGQSQHAQHHSLLIPTDRSESTVPLTAGCLLPFPPFPPMAPRADKLFPSAHTFDLVSVPKPSAVVPGAALVDDGQGSRTPPSRVFLTGFWSSPTYIDRALPAARRYYYRRRAVQLRPPGHPRTRLRRNTSIRDSRAALASALLEKAKEGAAVSSHIVFAASLDAIPHSPSPAGRGCC